MPRPSNVETLPKEVKKWLDHTLVESNFSGYQQLEEALRERGYQISKSSIHRYGQEFEKRLAALKMASEQAKAIAETIPDEENNLSDALLRLVQHKAFDMVMKMEADPKVGFGTLGKIAVESAGATTSIRKFRAEVRKRTKEVAEEIAQTAKKGGLSNETVEQIKRQILGIAA